MFDSCTLTLSDRQKMASAAKFLTKTLYEPATTIFLDGELGAGKTTFVQYLATALDITDTVNSPTYALEQRYPLPDKREFIHIDLYRLEEKQAQGILHASEDFQGIRCIEWADRLSPAVRASIPAIDLRLHVGVADERILACIFRDSPLPTREDVERWRTEVALPAHIQRHCDTVANLLKVYADHFLSEAKILRPLTLTRAGELHDLLRFTDFREESLRKADWLTEDMRRTWQTWKERYPNMQHEEAAAAFLTAKGFSTLASIIQTHGFEAKNRRTTEQQLLYYADKRVREDAVVSLRERFDDLIVRYANGRETENQKRWYAETLAVEKELFGDRPQKN
ncbi:MAG: hypothetical protein JWM56_1351 [Candidatus Peribacteria bacterium]|nr:hypothetical protein [Candidatus Peribacteria bacterium]